MNALYQRDLHFQLSHPLFAGIDEAGRGPLAGPVVIAAVVLDYSKPLEGLNDSKKLSPKKREILYEQIVASALDYSIVELDAEYIDEHNILQATLTGFAMAFSKLVTTPPFCLIDGKDTPKSMKPFAQAVVKGDSLQACIAAASVLAKVHRDRLMTYYDSIYPEYGFAQHKGYGTALHCRNIRTYGLSPIHRKSFHVPEGW
ncbi:MAG: ribonuclease HII [Candidatus Cloacimonas sp.]|nr:ribonuclease HII [Candidatus Cloacimonas sp.]